jgi:uncharacterized repeat protein (TIGR03803 family)
MWLTALRRLFAESFYPNRLARPHRIPPRVRQLEPRLTPSIITLASFDGADGAKPLGALAMDGSGNLYGATFAGGPNSHGTVFELAPGSGTITSLASIGPFATGPDGGVVVDSSGNLYGTTSGKIDGVRGTILELPHGNSTTATLAKFGGVFVGAYPEAGLLMDGSGNLYGTTYGGDVGVGTVFELPHGSTTITTLATFTGPNGARPEAGLVMDSSGNLYGTTYKGGAYGKGTVFELPHANGSLTTLASFDGTDGANPEAGLVMDASGDLYGTTFGGGASGHGTVFGLIPGSSTIFTLASFDGADGSNPKAGLLIDSSGNLYGTTSQGGTSGFGTAFELAKGSNTITTLAAFDGTNGSNPEAGLITDADGNLYGTTYSGGGSNVGTVFELPGALATTDQWTGANAAVDTNWSDGGNWSRGTPPTSSQTAVFTNDATVKSFTATVDAGFTHAIAGLVIDSSWGGTIIVSSPLSVTGNMLLASGSFGGSGAVTVAGAASRWTGGQIVVGSGGFTNTGALTADTTGGNLILTGAGILTNTGTITEAGTNSLVLENTAALSNAAGATFDVTNDGGVSQSGSGTFSNAGALEKTGGTGTSTIATTTFGNTGTVAVTSGTLDISASVTQVSGRTLTAGTWTVTGSPTVHATLDITSAGRLATLGSAAHVTLDGLNTSFTNLSGLATINKGASFSLLGGQSFSTTGALTDKGGLTLGPGSTLTVGGSFTQTSTGSLTAEVGGTDAVPTFGLLFSTTGTVALASSLTVTSTVVPAVGSSLTVLENEGNSAVSGIFAGLPEGGTFTVSVGTTTMTFQITYVGPGIYGSNNVLITRIS